MSDKIAWENKKGLIFYRVGGDFSLVIRLKRPFSFFTTLKFTYFLKSLTKII